MWYAIRGTFSSKVNQQPANKNRMLKNRCIAYSGSISYKTQHEYFIEMIEIIL